MTATFTGTFTLKRVLAGANTNEASALTASINDQIARAYTAGSGAGNINLISTDQVTRADVGSSDYDLDGGALTDMFGTAVTFATIKSVYVKNLGSVSEAEVGGDFLGITGTVKLPAGGVFWLDMGATGLPVTATTNDVISVSGVTGVAHEIVIQGVSA